MRRWPALLAFSCGLLLGSAGPSAVAAAQTGPLGIPGSHAALRAPAGWTATADGDSLAIRVAGSECRLRLWAQEGEDGTCETAERWALDWRVDWPLVRALLEHPPPRPFDDSALLEMAGKPSIDAQPPRGRAAFRRRADHKWYWAEVASVQGRADAVVCVALGPSERKSEVRGLADAAVGAVAFEPRYGYGDDRALPRSVTGWDVTGRTASFKDLCELAVPAGWTFWSGPPRRASAMDAPDPDAPKLLWLRCGSAVMYVRASPGGGSTPRALVAPGPKRTRSRWSDKLSSLLKPLRPALGLQPLPGADPQAGPAVADGAFAVGRCTIETGTRVAEAVLAVVPGRAIDVEIGATTLEGNADPGGGVEAVAGSVRFAEDQRLTYGGSLADGWAHAAESGAAGIALRVIAVGALCFTGVVLAWAARSSLRGRLPRGARRPWRPGALYTAFAVGAVTAMAMGVALASALWLAGCVIPLALASVTGQYLAPGAAKVGDVLATVLTVGLLLMGGPVLTRAAEKRWDPPGRPLPDDAEDSLWDALGVRRAAERLGVALPDEVRVCAGPELLAHTEGIGERGAAPGVVVLGMPAMVSLGVLSEPLVAHELAHLAIRRGSWQVKVLDTVEVGGNSLRRSLSELGCLMWHSAVAYALPALVVGMANAAFRRREELAADQIAARAYGPASYATSLLLLHALCWVYATRAESGPFAEVWSALDDDTQPDGGTAAALTWCREFSASLADLREAVRRMAQPGFGHPVSLGQAHPALSTRLAVVLGHTRGPLGMTCETPVHIAAVTDAALAALDERAREWAECMGA